MHHHSTRRISIESLFVCLNALQYYKGYAQKGADKAFEEIEEALKGDADCPQCLRLKARIEDIDISRG